MNCDLRQSRVFFSHANHVVDEQQQRSIISCLSKDEAMTLIGHKPNQNKLHCLPINRSPTSLYLIYSNNKQ
jgi:hypothetical protein